MEIDLGRIDHLLRNHGVEWPENFQQLVHFLRHGSIKQRDPTGTQSTICSMMRPLQTAPAGPDTSSRRSGREPLAAGTSPTSIGYYTVPAAWGGGMHPDQSPQSSTRNLPLRPWPSCPRRAEWCCDVARAAVIDCCSCRHHERSRRCLRR